jgi:hypothetical protein
MKIEIEIADVFTWDSRDQSFAFDVREVPAEKVADLVAKAVWAGFTKAGVDAASSARSLAVELAGFTVKRISPKTGKVSHIPIDWSDLDADQRAKALTRIDEATRTLTDKRLAAWKAGDWGATLETGSAVDPVTLKMIGMVRDLVKTANPKEYRDAEEKTRREMCKAYIAGLDAETVAEMKADAEDMVARDKADAERAAARAAKIAAKVKL